MSKLLLLIVMVGFLVVVTTVASAGDFITMNVRNLGATDHVNLMPFCIQFDTSGNCIKFGPVNLNVYP